MHQFDVVVVGGGPAGIAAACAASEAGVKVGLIDANPSPGGQIWRGEAASSQSTRWFSRLRQSSVELLTGAHVIDQPRPGRLVVERKGGSVGVAYQKLILATGARERWIPFPGWTLPNVMGAGGLQAMVKGGLPIAGKRVIVAGTGPLLLAVAAYLKKRGAHVPVISEQTSLARIAHFALSLAGSPGKLLQAAQLRWALRGTRYLTDCWPLSANGGGAVESVTLQCGGKRWQEQCDYFACGFGLVPNLELPMLLECAVRDGAVAVDEQQETSVQDVYCAGEPTGIGGVDLALLEGQIAGYASAGLKDRAASFFPARIRARKFADAMNSAFDLRDELRAIVHPETIVCRCEDVTFERLRTHASWRAAKLQTRCGMGPCQGRTCGPAVEFLLGWNDWSIRPPLFPSPVSQLINE